MVLPCGSPSLGRHYVTNRYQLIEVCYFEQLQCAFRGHELEIEKCLTLGDEKRRSAYQFGITVRFGICMTDAVHFFAVTNVWAVMDRVPVNGPNSL